MHFSLLHSHSSHARLQGETPWTRSAGVDHKPRSRPLDQRFMSMAEDDDVCSVAGQQCAGRWPAELVAVTDVDGEALDVECELGLQMGLAWNVRVPVNRLHRRDGAELIEHRSSADVARMKDQLNAFQGCEELGPNEAVSVRDKPDDHPANLYPIPWTVRMNCGWRGLGSIF